MPPRLGSNATRALLLAAVSCTSNAPAGIRAYVPAQRPSDGIDAANSAPDAGADNPDTTLLTVVDGGSYAGGRKDVPFQCTPGVFCARKERGQENCGTLTLTLDVQPSPINLLLIFDQSASMGDAWGKSGKTKIAAARAAIADVVASLGPLLHVGAIFFPTYACGRFVIPRAGGAVAPIDGAGQIPFQPAAQFLDAWNQHWSAGAALGRGTPLQEAFDRADQAIHAKSVSGPMVVVAVTDGEPNCSADPRYTLLPTAAEQDHAASWLQTDDIETYVVGLPGASGAQLLDDIANHGGTMNYILPDAPATLETKLQQIVQSTVQTHAQSCSIELVPPAFQPVSQLELDLVEVNGTRHDHVPRMLSSTSGWEVSSDGARVQLRGELCTQTALGSYSAITFEYGCDHSSTMQPQLN